MRALYDSLSAPARSLPCSPTGTRSIPCARSSHPAPETVRLHLREGAPRSYPHESAPEESRSPSQRASRRGALVRPCLRQSGSPPVCRVQLGGNVRREAWGRACCAPPRGWGGWQARVTSSREGSSGRRASRLPRPLLFADEVGKRRSGHREPEGCHNRRRSGNLGSA